MKEACIVYVCLYVWLCVCVFECVWCGGKSSKGTYRWCTRSSKRARTRLLNNKNTETLCVSHGIPKTKSTKMPNEQTFFFVFMIFFDNLLIGRKVGLFSYILKLKCLNEWRYISLISYSRSPHAKPWNIDWFFFCLKRKDLILVFVFKQDN